jgi:hypothetical protein
MHRILEQIKPETARLLEAQAQTLGLSVDEYLRMLLPANGPGDEEPLYDNATPEAWTRAFRQWAGSHRILPVIADDSRETIYEDRGQ